MRRVEIVEEVRSAFWDLRDRQFLIPKYDRELMYKNLRKETGFLRIIDDSQ